MFLFIYSQSVNNKDVFTVWQMLMKMWLIMVSNHKPYSCNHTISLGWHCIQTVWPIFYWNWQSKIKVSWVMTPNCNRKTPFSGIELRIFNPRLTETLFVTQLTNEGGGYHPPEIFKMNHRMMLILVPVVNLKSLL